MCYYCGQKDDIRDMRESVHIFWNVRIILSWIWGTNNKSADIFKSGMLFHTEDACRFWDIGENLAVVWDYGKLRTEQKSKAHSCVRRLYFPIFCLEFFEGRAIFLYGKNSPGFVYICFWRTSLNRLRFIPEPIKIAFEDSEGSKPVTE